MKIDRYDINVSVYGQLTEAQFIETCMRENLFVEYGEVSRITFIKEVHKLIQNEFVSLQST